MLRDFGLVTLIDLSVSLVGVLVALPAALVIAERSPSRRQRCASGASAGAGAVGVTRRHVGERLARPVGPGSRAS